MEIYHLSKYAVNDAQMLFADTVFFLCFEVTEYITDFLPVPAVFSELIMCSSLSLCGTEISHVTFVKIRRLKYVSVASEAEKIYTNMNKQLKYHQMYRRVLEHI